MSWRNGFQSSCTYKTESVNAESKKLPSPPWSGDVGDAAVARRIEVGEDGDVPAGTELTARVTVVEVVKPTFTSWLPPHPAMWPAISSRIVHLSIWELCGRLAAFHPTEMPFG